MIIQNAEDMASSRTGCYPTLYCLYNIIPRDVRLHMERVGIYADIFYRFLLERQILTPDSFDADFEICARDLFTLHDIGRAFVPIRFQNKAGKLTDEEYEQIKRHTVLTPEVMDSIYEIELTPAMQQMLSNIALYHHERWDGSGYPFGLQSEGIPLEARICALADAYDGMTSWKAYRQSMDTDTVTKIMTEEKGRQFDPELAEAFIECMQRLPRDLEASWESQAGNYFSKNEGQVG